MLKQLNPEPESDVQIPLAPQSPIPVDYNALAQEEALQQAVPARAPALGSNNEQAISRGPASDVSIKSTSKSMNSGSAPVTEGAEERLERMMRELNEERNREREEAASRQMKANIFKAITDNVGNIVGGAQAMNTKASVNPVQVKGFDPGDLVAGVDKKFSGDREALLDQYKQLLNARDKSEQRKYQQDSLQVQREGNDIKRLLANQKANKLVNTLSPGEKKVDENFAKDFNNLTSKGFNNAETAIGRILEVAKELEANKDSVTAGGGRSSILPDSLRSRDSIRWRDAAQNEANATLKELFPGSLSDDERRAAAKEFYNDQLSNEENAKILRAKASQLQRSLQDQRSKADYFGSQGTLKGMSNSAPSNAPSDVDSKIDAFMKKNSITDRNEAIKILKENNKI